MYARQGYKAAPFLFSGSPLLHRSLFASSTARRSYFGDSRLSNSNNSLVLNDHGGLHAPKLQFEPKGAAITLFGDLRLRDLER